MDQPQPNVIYAAVKDKMNSTLSSSSSSSSSATSSYPVKDVKVPNPPPPGGHNTERTSTVFLPNGSSNVVKFSENTDVKVKDNFGRIRISN